MCKKKNHLKVKCVVVEQVNERNIIYIFEISASIQLKLEQVSEV